MMSFSLSRDPKYERIAAVCVWRMQACFAEREPECTNRKLTVLICFFTVNLKAPMLTDGQQYIYHLVASLKIQGWGGGGVEA